MANILAVDDNLELCKLIRTTLERDGHRVETRQAGGALTEPLCRWADCILLDVMMPGEDGFAVCRRIRAETDAPILFLTARTDEPSVLTGLGLGADDYLTKPFAAKELLARIRAMTRAATAIDATTLSVGNVRLDTASCTLVGPLGEEHLANREFQLMELFMRNAGTRMPTERLMLEVWGEDAPEGANVVWVYISYLRKKLAALGANVAIRASRNQGYSLEVVEEGEQA